MPMSRMKGAGLTVLLTLASVSLAAAQPRLLYVGTVVTGGNGDDWIEPGETVALSLGLFNEGTATATSVHGTLTYMGTHPGVAVTIPAATWPDIPPHAAPVATDPPHFELQLGAPLPCGAVLPFRLEVTVSGGSDAVSWDFTLEAGQRIEHDMMPDPVKRFEEQEATFWGAAPSDSFGSAVATGDINGDGFSDVVVTAARDVFTPAILYVIYGQARQMVDRDMSLPGAGVSLFTGLEGFQPNNVATGDVNGDGYDDIVLGSGLQDTLGRADAGLVAVIYGMSAQWPNTSLTAVGPIAGVARFSGPDAGDVFGFKVATGDIDGDGFDDVIATSRFGDSIGNTRINGGEAHLIYGRPAPWTDTDLLNPPAGVARFWGVDPGDELRQAVTGDVNGDGFDDLLLDAPLADSVGNQRTSAGEVTLIYGRQADWPDTDLASPPAGIVRFWGTNAGGAGALQARTTGDFDGDGVDDLILGSGWGSLSGRPAAFQLTVIHGGSSTFTDMDLQVPQQGIVRILGESPDDALGSFRVAAGDLNGDGYDDLVAGAHHPSAVNQAPGAAYVIHGGPGRWPDIDLLDPPSTVAVFRGVDNMDAMGVSVATGDIDDDGYDDLLVGASSAESLGNSRPGAGEIYLWYGKPTDTYYAAPPAAAASPYIDTTLVKGATKLPLSCDDCSVPLPIGFPFTFYAEDFDTVFVSSDGYLFFSQPPGGVTFPEACMPDRGGANHLIAPFHDDLNPAASPPAGGVFALLQGTAPNRRLTIEWKDVPHATSTGLATFEVTLYETTGQIHFRYKDLIFGVPGLDNGASAVVGVENRTGAHGVPFSCNVDTILSVTRLVRFVPTTPVLEERAEQKPALWDPTGHWHNATGTCEPDQHSGARGWYYGNAHLCSYSNGFSGALRFPTVGDFPADARLAYWSRLGIQAGFDLAELQLSTTGTGGPYATFQNGVASLASWRYGGVSNLFSNAGDTVDLQFSFTTDGSVTSLGWMVDDIQVVGCDATGASQVAQPASYAPPQVCVGSAAIADAIGSYCGDTFDPVRWQWYENGAAIPGADEVTHTISDTVLPAGYEYSVEITCESGATAMSDPAPVAVVVPPDPVVPLDVEMQQARPAPRLLFRWEAAAGADDYVILQDAIPSGGFATVTGTSPPGALSLGVPIPPGDLVYFLVAGRNLGCGLGPIR